MARSIRIEFPSAFYHVMARGNRHEAIFGGDEDRELFLQTLGEACAMTGWRIHGWVLMGNHYHLLLQTPEANLVAGMQWLQNTYTRRFNTRHRSWGRLFGDRYKAVLLEDSPYYYETLLDYIHLNPVRAGLINPRRGESVQDYAWSSLAQGYALSPRQRASWLAVAEGLENLSLPDNAAGRRGMVESLDRRALEEGLERAGIPPSAPEVDRRLSHLRRGWYWGSQQFAQRVLRLADAALRKQRHPSGRGGGESKAHGEAEAGRLLQEGLRAAGLKRPDLSRLKGSDPRKVAIARVIWHNTSVQMSWIAEKLAMKSASNVSQQLRRRAIQARTRTLPKTLARWENSHDS